MSTDGTCEAFERHQKELFTELVQRKIREQNIQLVAEEARYGDETVTQLLCASEGCRYANIEMLPEERTDRNIPAGYHEDVGISEAEKARGHLEREEYMFGRTIAEAGDAESVLVICGRIHTEPLAHRFREAGHSVETSDLLDENWYVENWQQHMMNL